MRPPGVFNSVILSAKPLMKTLFIIQVFTPLLSPSPFVLVLPVPLSFIFFYHLFLSFLSPFPFLFLEYLSFFLLLLLSIISSFIFFSSLSPSISPLSSPSFVFLSSPSLSSFSSLLFVHLPLLQKYIEKIQVVFDGNLWVGCTWPKSSIGGTLG